MANTGPIGANTTATADTGAPGAPIVRIRQTGPRKVTIDYVPPTADSDGEPLTGNFSRFDAAVAQCDEATKDQMVAAGDWAALAALPEYQAVQFGPSDLAPDPDGVPTFTRDFPILSAGLPYAVFGTATDDAV